MLIAEIQSGEKRTGATEPARPSLFPSLSRLAPVPRTAGVAPGAHMPNGDPPNVMLWGADPAAPDTRR